MQRRLDLVASSSGILATQVSKAQIDDVLGAQLRVFSQALKANDGQERFTRCKGRPYPWHGEALNDPDKDCEEASEGMPLGVRRVCPAGGT